MFRSLFLFRRLLATSFLVVFVNVFVGQCWCASLASAATPSAARAQSVVPTKSAHAGCHGMASKKAQHKARHAQKPCHSTGKHDCCKDKSASLLSSLTTPAEKHLFTPAPALLPADTDFLFRPVAGHWDSTGVVMLVLREHLPPKIPDIRIFIQSLTV
jgi:hypothetical protein